MYVEVEFEELVESRFHFELWSSDQSKGFEGTFEEGTFDLVKDNTSGKRTLDDGWDWVIFSKL